MIFKTINDYINTTNKSIKEITTSLTSLDSKNKILEKTHLNTTNMQSQIIDIDSLFPKINDDRFVSILQNLTKVNSEVLNGTKFWQDYFNELSDSEKWQIEFIQNTDMQKVSLDSLKKGYESARQAAIAHNETLQKQTSTITIITEAVASAGKKLLLLAASKLIEYVANYSKRLEESAKKTQEIFDKTKNDVQTLESLITEYNELHLSNEWDNTAIETKKRIHEEINQLLNDEATKIDIINGKYKETSIELYKQKIASLDEAYRTAKDNVNTNQANALQKGNEATKWYGQISVKGYETDIQREYLEKYSDIFDVTTKQAGFTKFDYVIVDYKDYKDLINKHTLMGQMLVEMSNNDLNDDMLYININKLYNNQKDAIDKAINAEKDLIKIESQRTIGNILISKNNGFDGYIEDENEYLKVIEFIKNSNYKNKNDLLQTLADEFYHFSTNSNTTSLNTLSLSTLKYASEAISYVQNAFNELSNDGYISISTISSIQEATGLSGDAWKEYENNLLSAKAGTEEFNNILGKLTYRILENKLGTEDLTNATEAQIATILRENGVLNSAAIAQDLLASKKNNTIFDSSKIVFADTSNDTGDFTTEPYRESDGYFKYAEDLYKAHQNESKYINDLQWGLDNLVKSEEERLEILDKINQSAHNQVSNLEHQIQMKKNAEGDDADVRGYYQDIQKIAHAEAERLRNQGYDDSNANIKEWQNIWWDAQSKIVEANEKIIASIDETVAEANELLDGFQNVYTTLTDVAKEYNTNGYLSADSLQSILELGPKYLDYLYDENGQLVVNKQALENIIAAQTERMAVEQAYAYAKQILAAAEKGDIQALTNLTQVTANSSDATWDMAYATIALAKAIGTANGMDASYFDDAYSSLVKMQDMTQIAVNSMSRYYDTLEDGYISEKEGLDKILELTQEMIKWENEQKIEALENEKKAYQDIINKKKEMLQLAKEESEHEDSIAEKIKEIAELQSKVEQLSLDDSREAQAQKKGLEEELGELQKELADEQSDYAVDAQIDALDRELEEFELAKDKEIAEQEAMLDSTEELYQAAIERIDTDWDGLYFDLLAWNAQYGSSLESDIVAAWDAASAAVQE